MDVEPVAASIGGQVAVATHDEHLHHAVGHERIGPVRVLHGAPGVERGPQRTLLQVVRVLHPTVHHDRRRRRADEQGVADRDAGVLEPSIGPRVSGRRWLGHTGGRQLISRDGHVGEFVLAWHGGAEEREAEAADVGDAEDRLDLGTDVAPESAAQERVASGARVDDHVGVLGRMAPVDPRNNPSSSPPSSSRRG
ncbi:MAG: hypothetical protein R2713_07720 [Ilumatobacteraceae bacterium]